jgi:threonine synthase
MSVETRNGRRTTTAAAGSLRDSRYVASNFARGASQGIWRFRESLPTFPSAVTLGEGSTALLRLRADAFAGASVYAKHEHRNPTGSFKDRGSALVAAAARAAGARTLAIASTGNAGASMAAYAAQAQQRLLVFVPRSTAPGKLWQMTAHGAEIHLIDGEFSDCEAAYREAVAAGAFPAGSDNPLRQEGTKTIAFELHEELPCIDRVIAAAGTGGLAVSLHMGFEQIAASTPGYVMPCIDVVQLEALKPFAGHDPARKAVATAAGGINIANPTLREPVLRALSATGGTLHSISEAELLEAQEILAKGEGLGAEPTGSVSTAAYLRARREATIGKEEVVVVIVTGHILKAPIQLPERTA